MTILEYDTTQPSMQKAWKAEFSDFLIEYYKPSIINADKVFKAIGNVDAFIKKHTSLNTKMILMKSIDEVDDLRRKLLSHRPNAMKPTVSANDYRVIVLDRYYEFLSDPNRLVENARPQTEEEHKESNNKPTSDEIQNATEGMMKEVVFFRKQRNRAIRNECAKKYNYTCQVCGFNFEKVYGERGKEFIEVHHLKPVSSYDEEHDVKLEDLIALCSNCHSMIHHGSKLIDPDKLKKEMEEQKQAMN